MAKFTRINAGMSYQDVVKIIGRQGEVLSRSDLAGITTVMYQWSDSRGLANMNAIFQNGKLVNKAQFGLK